MWRSIHKQIGGRIDSLPAGAVLTVTDFSDLAEAKTVSKCLRRFTEKGRIAKVLRGIFWKPDGASPSPDAVARALARSNLWQVVPCGDTALHLTGLSEQAPPEWTYLTDGTNRRYGFAGHVITFRHATGKTFLSERAALLVQAVKACGKSPLSQEHSRKLCAYFRPEEWAALLAETKHTTAWVRKAIRSLFSRRETA